MLEQGSLGLCYSVQRSHRRSRGDSAPLVQHTARGGLAESIDRLRRRAVAVLALAE